MASLQIGAVTRALMCLFMARLIPLITHWTDNSPPSAVALFRFIRLVLNSPVGSRKTDVLKPSISEIWDIVEYSTGMFNALAVLSNTPLLPIITYLAILLIAGDFKAFKMISCPIPYGSPIVTPMSNLDFLFFFILLKPLFS